MRIDWKIKHFNSLSTKELLFFVNLRVKVFVIEQNCPYPEADGLDYSSFHVICKNNSNQLIETAGIILPSKLYVKYSIVKIVFRQEFRQISIGKQLLQLCISYLKKQLDALRECHIHENPLQKVVDELTAKNLELQASLQSLQE